ncbi:hypothetical protein Pmar_PMAR025997 [Perkinsus marinus ATCC 50983]|uniref:Uncharacterized protein n=1 Tax=Perkinsus marinus (strain ATCC 50983 / TXsc) TaxID=423536 RepID=C5LK52_PERM5|nr:hypothetical protein Pmar_PMAR025997 [Perkinsus marinus ATCC 50983]EER02839.1 hypothetical protein Pmar_PMAR025997 [Perkinsus marinus ATCC 50983]|eukprot:XP_002771023.1 hypothetical protein Pmar_PMAR025997 [Perkinsus marinus ATCC 50983]
MFKQLSSDTRAEVVDSEKKCTALEGICSLENKGEKREDGEASPDKSQEKNEMGESSPSRHVDMARRNASEMENCPGDAYQILS